MEPKAMDPESAKALINSFKVLFQDAGRDAAERWRTGADPVLLSRVERLLQGIAAELADHGTIGFDDGRIDTIDQLNSLAAAYPATPLATLLEDAFFGVLPSLHVELPDLLRKHNPHAEQLHFYLDHARNLLRLPALLKAELERRPGDSRLNPLVPAMLAGKTILNEPDERLAALAGLREPFAASRVFRFIDGRFLPVTLEGIRPADHFYGYHGPRQIFADHLHDFCAGHGNVPLLISGLPGLGKTQLSIACVLAREELTLVMAEPEALERQLEVLIAALARWKRRRFVIFFDDIDPSKIDWYGFRTHVGGSLHLPDNLLMLIASNYEFPANILSRGREATFPVFDEIRCQEMVEDFLADLGMKKENSNLAAVIAGNYVEEFAQKKYTELSPRTLMRYLERYRREPALRRRVLTLSQQEMIISPDAQVFYEFNIKVMRALYGDAYIERLLQERLKSL